MQSSEEAPKSPNWIPTSFATASETGELDSVSSFQSVATPGSNLADLQSNDQSFVSFDVSEQKSSITNEENIEKTNTESTSAINVFEEDARSSWSEEPKQTEFKETVIDDCLLNNEISQNSVSSEKSHKSTNSQKSHKSTSSQKSHKSTSSQKSHKSTSSQKSHKSTSSQKSHKSTSSHKSHKSISSQKSHKSTSSQKSHKSSVSQKSLKKESLDDENEENKREFPPENLFEYMWPQENGEFFILQEQICDYLNVKSFKRKYPDLFRRPVEVPERKFLKEKGVVTEMQCDLGLTALRSEEVLELMSKDYPDHYKEYIKVLREKEQQNITEKHKEYVSTNSDKNKMMELVKKAMQSAAEYNAHLNQERREERRSCMDLQTFTIHYPAKTNKIKKNTKPGKYPVALLPGQFQDYYKEYTSKELKYLPVNTVLYGPLKELTSIKAQSDGSQSDSDDSTASDGSCSSSQGTHDDSSSGSEKPEVNNKKSGTPRSASPYTPKVKPNSTCKVCKTGADSKVKDGKPEELVHCSDCENSAHPSCIELTPEVVAVLKTYPWQCMDCKVCSHCRDPNEEDKMLFCDICDRGYHTFCVGLKNLPQGKWICRQCGSCSVCGANKPGPESSKAQWQVEVYIKNETDGKKSNPKLLCVSCSKKKK